MVKRVILTLVLMLIAAVISAAAINPTAAQMTLVDAKMQLGKQDIETGSLTAVLEGDNLKVTYNTINGWTINDTHLYIGSSAPNVSLLGAFPFKHEGLNGVTSDNYVVSLSEFGLTGGDTVFIAAEASVQKPALPGLLKESVWANISPAPSEENSKFFSVIISYPGIFDKIIKWFPFKIQKRAA
ncbi:MAG: hypothetical protein V1767_04845 [Chloroflexota bacterium]